MAPLSAGNYGHHLTFERERIHMLVELKRQKELEATVLHGGKSSAGPVGVKSSQVGSNLGQGHWL